MKLNCLGRALAIAFGISGTPAVAADKPLDYEVFKSKVQPIFLKKRGDHVRCVVCHAHAATAFKLEELPKDGKTWSEEQTRHNFEVVSKLVIPSKPDESPILMHPLATQAGGHAYHSGGRQFASKNDPDWKTIAQWAGALKTASKQ